ncbi:MAG: hypothetical protein FVQ77_13170 [Cytophagales bacterium]|nr:hypothetical protein [Cytophagales bacterium]
MKTRKKYLLSALIIIFMAPLYQGCKKYDEGPVFSLRSKKARLTGKYEVTSYLRDGKDFLNYVDKFESSGYDFMCSSNYKETSSGTSEFIYEFTENGYVDITETFNKTIIRKYDFNCSDSSFTDSDTEITFGEWEFRHKKNDLRLTMYYNGSIVKEEYEIVKLTKDELKLNGFIFNFNNVEKAEIELKKK